MRKSMSFLACLMLVLTAWTGVVHAADAVVCTEMSQAMQVHAVCAGDRVPPDANQACPHHHAGCLGHHIGPPVAGDVSRYADASGHAFRARRDLALTSHDADRTLRPPQV